MNLDTLDKLIERLKQNLKSNWLLIEHYTKKREQLLDKKKYKVN